MHIFTCFSFGVREEEDTTSAFIGSCKYHVCGSTNAGTTSMRASSPKGTRNGGDERPKEELDAQDISTPVRSKGKGKSKGKAAAVCLAVYDDDSDSDVEANEVNVLKTDGCTSSHGGSSSPCGLELKTDGCTSSHGGSSSPCGLELNNDGCTASYGGSSSPYGLACTPPLGEVRHLGHEFTNPYGAYL